MTFARRVASDVWHVEDDERVTLCGELLLGMVEVVNGATCEGRLCCHCADLAPATSDADAATEAPHG